jgi:hypothetical protein
MENTKAINKIDVERKTLKDMLSQKYIVDYFQREYKWKIKHVEDLLNDLQTRFLQDYKEGDTIKDVAKYGYYYLGSIILSSEGTEYSIIDGQQRLTTLTLLLIYLNNLQNDLKIDRPIVLSNLISEEDYDFSPNIGVKDWTPCLKSLFEGKGFNLMDQDNSIRNLVTRYEDMSSLLNERIQEDLLKHFIVWLKQNVLFSQIITYSDDDAYRIFEAMNDRGMDLTYSELLKGYLLVKLKDEDKISELNADWKQNFGKLNQLRENEDLKFFMSFLRAKYAKTTAQKDKGVSSGDFENIGSNFYRWLINHEKTANLKSRKEILNLLEKEIPFFIKLHEKIFNASQNFDKNLDSIYYLNKLGFAESIYYSLLTSSIKIDDNNETINKKLSLVSKYLEIFTVFMAVNSKRYAQSLIKNSLFPLVIKIRDTPINDLKEILLKEFNNLEYTLDGINQEMHPTEYNPGGILNLSLNGQNRKFIKFLLARMTTYIENGSAKETSFENYLNTTQKKPFQIEHLWCDDYNQFKEEFDQSVEWVKYRNSIGALVLLPEGTNQSHNKDSYEKKLKHYLKENLLAQSLHPECYNKNPNFVKFFKKLNLPFKAHENFKKQDIIERKHLVKKICKIIYNGDAFRKDPE